MLDLPLECTVCKLGAWLGMKLTEVHAYKECLVRGPNIDAPVCFQFELWAGEITAVAFVVVGSYVPFIMY